MGMPLGECFIRHQILSDSMEDAMSPGGTENIAHHRSARRIDGALTIDLEDWRCALDPDPKADYRSRPKPSEEFLRTSTKTLLSELDKLDAKATFFVLGEVALAVPEVVKDVSRAGHEVASHSPVHLPPRMIPRDAFADLLRRDVCVLEEITGDKPIGFRAPYFALRRDEGWLLKILSELDFQYDSTVVPTWTPYWGIPSAPKHAYFPDFSDIAKGVDGGPLLEFPVTVWPSWRMLPGLPIGGGFYMRAWPRPLLGSFMRRNVRKGLPLVIYIHPGNLESKKERVVAPSMRDRLSQYAGAGRGLSSFRYLLDNFRFGTIREAFSSELDQLKTRA